MRVNVVAVTSIQNAAPVHASTVGSVAAKTPGNACTVIVPAVVVAGTVPLAFNMLMACGVPDGVTIVVVVPTTLKHRSTNAIPLPMVVAAPVQLITKLPADGLVMEAAPQAGSPALKFCAPV